MHTSSQMEMNPSFKARTLYAWQQLTVAALASQVVVRLPRTLATAGTSYRESRSTFMLSILYQCSGAKNLQTACILQTYLLFSSLSVRRRDLPWKTNFVPFYDFCLCILCQISSVSKVHYYLNVTHLFSASGSMDFSASLGMLQLV